LHQNWFRSKTKGAPREGSALLQGIVWCGRCGSKMGVTTYSIKEHRRPSYICVKDYSNGAPTSCQSMSSKPVDDLIVKLFLEVMAPAQFEITKAAVAKMQVEKTLLKKQWEQQLTQARYDAQLAQRQYDSVDPSNRLVASELERRWNEKLEELQKLEKSYEDANRQDHFSLTSEEAKEMEAVVKDLPKIWHAPTTTNQERKQLLRLVITEVQLDGITIPGKIEIRITWRSGAISTRIIDRLKVGVWAPKTSNLVVERIRELSREYIVSQIVALLNQEGLRSAHNKELQEHHILYIARRYGISVTNDPKRIKKQH
jgi:hypothetical protein